MTTFYDLTKQDTADDLKAYRGKWRNLYFNTDGTTIYGTDLHDDMQAANDAISFSSRYLNDGAFICAIPMPIGDAP